MRSEIDGILAASFEYWPIQATQSVSVAGLEPVPARRQRMRNIE
jgi:hypothetical protein